METLWLSAVLFPSSEQENCGTKMVTFTCSCWASSVASSLFMVDKPPLNESHSLANRVTLSAVLDFPWFSFASESCVVGTLIEGLKSYKRTIPTIKVEHQIKQSRFDLARSLSTKMYLMDTILNIANFTLWHGVPSSKGEYKHNYCLMVQELRWTPPVWDS